MSKKERIFVWIGFAGAVLVFVKHRYVCECEAFVNGNARSQIANWPAEARGDVSLHLLDIEKRADVAKQYEVIRTPSMLLLDSNGEIVWRQDGVTQSTSDDLPLDLEQTEKQIAGLTQRP